MIKETQTRNEIKKEVEKVYIYAYLIENLTLPPTTIKNIIKSL